MTCDGDGAEYGGAVPIDGSFTENSFEKLYKMANLNPSSIFLDVGCSARRACLYARAAFKCALVLGIDVARLRLANACGNILANKIDRMFLLHLPVEHFQYLDPATHVYCYNEGMPPDFAFAIMAVSCELAKCLAKCGGGKFNDCVQENNTETVEPVAYHPPMSSLCALDGKLFDEYIRQLQAHLVGNAPVSFYALLKKRYRDPCCSYTAGSNPALLSGDALDESSFWGRFATVLFCNNVKFAPPDNLKLQNRIQDAKNLRISSEVAAPPTVVIDLTETPDPQAPPVYIELGRESYSSTLTATKSTA
ncbi:hypothetical protein H257_17404 [Aphanomyces astaci]|uniref:Methyltransferase domain-containing protein n=1 Tax=Aphanomyces astaci TaxID=112090 RepID=W4FET8_APHAT|nr:hypothetical protein H257_17404 [Aphanomyces astaci]ETV65985.1 hypothetical protein H257_17404 [Aphanomyces astaci]|eukprot:XP_009844504.1 hypothetical protein H257_17404 [Aphanomyces astaci]